jgi:hypothetical protein
MVDYALSSPSEKGYVNSLLYDWLLALHVVLHDSSGDCLSGRGCLLLLAILPWMYIRFLFAVYQVKSIFG